MKKRVKIVFMYLFLIIGILLSTNFLCWIFLELKASQITPDTKYKLPNYKNKQLAKLTFEEDSYLDLSTEYTPFTEWKFPLFHGSTVQVDNLGYRITNHYADRPQKKCYFFGGSTMWGSGSDNNNTIPALWNKMNKADFAYNYGVKAHNVRQNLESLINILSEGKKVDLVIFYEGVNEIFLCKNNISQHGHMYEELYKNRIKNYEKDTNKPVLPIILWRYSREFLARFYYKFFQNEKAKINEINQAYKPTKAKQAAIQLVNTLKIAKILVEAQGGKFIAILQPVSFIEKPKVTHVDFKIYAPSFKETYISLYREVKTIMKENNYDWLYDFTDAYNKNEYIYVDWCHVSPNGNQIIASKIDSILKYDSRFNTKKASF